MLRCYFVYIMTNKPNGTLYVGVTNNLERRVYEHKTGRGGVFTKKYKLYNLVFFDETNDIRQAIATEKQMKHWNRKYKKNTIELRNPEWKDLSEGWFDG